MSTIRISHQHRQALSLIEVLVVIAIIAILIGLLLPAIQKVREAAARAQCQNNLKQVGVALQNFAGDQGHFPAASTPVNGTSMPATFHGWNVFVLPYLEQGMLYANYHFEVDWFAAANANAIAMPLKVFQCPSTPNGFGQLVTGTATPSAASADQTSPVNWSAARSDYINMGGLATVLSMPADITIPEGYSSSNVLPASGVIGSSGHLVRFEDMTDGASSTLIVSEDAGIPSNWQMGQQVTANPPNYRFTDPNDAAAGGTWAGAGLGVSDSIGGKGWALDGYNPVVMVANSVNRGTNPDLTSISYPQITGTCAVNCTNDQEIYSFHPGGSNGLMADGSVHFFSSQTSLRTMAAVITFSGGEIIGTDF